MANIGSFGRVRVFEDFLGSSYAAAMGTTALGVGNIAYVSVNEGTFAPTVDEPGGILAITTDTADNDNCFLYAGPFKPADGGCVMEARFKTADITTVAMWCGFSETLDATTPVCPAEYATATLAINGSGGMAGLLWDPDGSANDWRAVAGDGGVVDANLTTSTGTLSSEDAVNDEWDVVRVEIGASGHVTIIQNGTVVDDFDSNLTTTDVFHACLGFENRSDAATTSEVDYFYAEGGRDWTAS